MHATERQLQMIHTYIMGSTLEDVLELEPPVAAVLPKRSGKRFSRDCITCCLCDLGVGETAIIREGEWQAENSALLESYGFFPGTAVTRVGNAPQGDPLIFRLDRRLVAVGRESAFNLLVVRERK